MARDRPRILITLSPEKLEQLHWLSAEESELPATLARRILSAGLEAWMARPHLALRYLDWQAGRQREAALQADVVDALSSPGVADVLAGHYSGATQAQLQAAAFLAHLSSWLEDRRPDGEKGPRPRLAQYASAAPLDSAFAELPPALAGADERTRLLAAAGVSPGASDKRQLSDIAPLAEGEEAGDAP